MGKTCIAESEEPVTYDEAINCKQSIHWKEAVDSAMASLEGNETQTEKLTKNANAITCKWVYKIKKSPDEPIDKFKARLVAKAFTQDLGVDYNQMLSLVTMLGLFVQLSVLQIMRKMYLSQFDA
ncbi:uncharacterized mitochondrial protein AtMg00820-like [Stegodyphus dumicola]|uniref:uncharacterized mitochondrial protein AtMg00820-like n=1 Tax=Stegodyphus dumicola TaxID=202533 RepID=UPI0015A84421|nr:uncharacterized mitochondrial protein AtMg00820-like [Stegodyphus dumicola]